MATNAAVLDSCVLYPAPLRDFLLSLAGSDLFRPRWTDKIHEEWIVSLLKNRRDLSRGQVERTRDRMNLAFPDALVQGFEAFINLLVLPDLNDRHVLAAAIHSRADAIITANLADFPPAALAPHGIVAVSPDQFGDYLFDLDEDEAFAAIAKMRARLKAPVMTAADIVDSLEKNGLSAVAARLRRNTGRF